MTTHKRLDSKVKAAKNVNVAPTNAARIGVLKSRRISRQHRGYFYVRHYGTSPYGWAVRGIARCAGSLTRYANLHGSAHPDWRRGKRFASSAVKEATLVTFVRRARRAQSPRLTSIIPGQTDDVSASRIDAWRLLELLRNRLHPAVCVTSSLMGGWFASSAHVRASGKAVCGSNNERGTA